MKKFALYLLAGLIALAAFPGAAGAKGTGIKKCRDATGRWHYGDTAAAACASSKVIVIDDRGVRKEVIEPPPTDEELRERESQKAEADRVKDQAKRDELLLSTYAHEADITYIRDRKLSQIDAMIKASVDTLKPLRATLERLEKQAVEEERREGKVSEQTDKALAQTRSQIEKHEAAVERRRAEQEAVRSKAEQDLQRYRELKGLSAEGADAKR